ncbi:MAG: dolichyl-phosphate beta-glucosyltransferase [Patescibacteria group bacterium]
MARPFLTIVIPAYNEAERLPLTLLAIDRHLSEAEYSSEILVLNDGSTDATGDIVLRMSRAIKNLKLIDTGSHSGKGSAVRKGMLLARGQIRLFLDADYSTPLSDFEIMMPLLRAGAQVVIGSRSHAQSQLVVRQNFGRQVMGKLGNFAVQALFLPRVWDTQCGFKAFTEKAAEDIFEVSKTEGWAFDMEILSLAKRLGYEIKETPVHWTNSPFSHVSYSAYLQTLQEAIKIRWRLSKFDAYYKPRERTFI